MIQQGKWSDNGLGPPHKFTTAASRGARIASATGVGYGGRAARPRAGSIPPRSLSGGELDPLKSVLLWSSTSPTLAHRVPRLPFVRRAVRRFLPGEELEDGLREAAFLEGHGLESLLTLLGENVTTPRESGEVTEHYARALTEICRRQLRAEISVKPTHLGLDLGRPVVESNLERLVALAEETGNFVWIDMEGSDYTEATLELFGTLAARHRRVGLCVQAYLLRTEADVEALLRAEVPALRLVKGAYAEPASIAYGRKVEVDRAYYRIACRLLDRASLGNGFRPGIATHDLPLLSRIRSEADRLGVARDAYEIQMLYGIGTDTQLRLRREGHRVRVLVSYGPAWFAWYMRRLAERPANLAFVLRSLFAR